MPKITKLPSNSNRSILLKDLTWDDRKRYWQTSDYRSQWAKFNDDQLNGGGKFKIKNSLRIEANDLDSFFYGNGDSEGKENITSKLLKRIESCDIVDLSLENQNITYAEYIKLTSTKRIECLYLDFVKITFNDGTAVPLNRILVQIPKLERLTIKGDYFDESKFNSMTAKKLFELPVFENLWVFELHDISDAFNVDDFCDFIMKHKSQKVDYYLYLRYPSTKNKYTKKFYAAMNKIIEEWKVKHELLIMVNGLEYPFEY